jgi:hypothetical protein
MNEPNATRETLHTGNLDYNSAILRELHEITASPHFCNSKRYPAFLRFIVENTLAGRTELLKERTLGVEVFDRPPTYDTNADTVVRYTAGEVRKRLLLYYSEHGRNSVRISLPVGSYIPEFQFHSPEDHKETGEHSGLPATQVPHSEILDSLNAESPESGLALATVLPVHPPGEEFRAGAASRTPGYRRLIVALAAAIVLALGAGWWGFGLWQRQHSFHPSTAVDLFWAPIIREQRTILLCSGGNVFALHTPSGTQTANKNNDYPWVSMQIASAISMVSGMLERSGATTQLVPAAFASLTDLREHPVTLLGAYNNPWTQRLIEPLRFHLNGRTDQAIVDRLHPETHWARDPSLPYSNADDYAIVARFRDSNIDDWVVVLAGLGRNGSEAAAEFATSPRYMQLLRDQLGQDFGNRNIEVVLKVSVIDGKTGAPAILAVNTW